MFPEEEAIVDAYVFLWVAPGMARSVMEELVAGRAARAVAVTGEADVIARVEDIDWDGFSAYVMSELPQIEGIEASSSAVVVPASAMADPIDPEPGPLPFWSPTSERAALVLVDVDSGAALGVLEALRGVEEVAAVAVLTGLHDMMLQVVGPDFDAIAAVVGSRIHSIAGISQTTTSLILEATAPAERS